MILSSKHFSICSSFSFLISEIVFAHCDAFLPKCAIRIIVVGEFFLALSFNSESSSRKSHRNGEDWVKESEHKLFERPIHVAGYAYLDINHG